LRAWRYRTSSCARALSLRPQSLDLLRREEALYREVLKREPDHPEGLTGLAYSLLLEAHNFGSKLEGTVRQRCYEEGGNLARRAREVDPDNPRVYGLLSIYAISHDDYPGALHADEEAYRLDPRNIRVCNGLAVTLLRGAQAQRAIELLTRAIGLDPVHPYDMLFFNLGWAHFMLGDFVAAIDWLERALLRNAAYPNTTAYLAMSHAMLGDVSRAKEMVKKTREIDPAFGYSSLSKIGTTTPAAFARWREGPFTEAWKRAGLPD
jgi:tetratricopeptide (TPR) repeat protein